MSSLHEKREVYNCDLTINQQGFTRLEISQYYKTKPGREKITDDLIQKLVKQLELQRHFPEDRKRNYQYFSHEPVYDNKGKAYKLVWCFDDETPHMIGIIDCYPRRKFNKYDKKTK